MYSGGAAQSAPALNGSIKKASVPASHTLHKDGGLKLPWYHLGSQHPRGHCLKTAAGSSCLQPDALTGAPVAD